MIKLSAVSCPAGNVPTKLAQGPCRVIVALGDGSVSVALCDRKGAYAENLSIGLSTIAGQTLVLSPGDDLYGIPVPSATEPGVVQVLEFGAL